MSTATAAPMPVVSGDFAPARAVHLADEVSYAPGSIVSRIVSKARGGSLTLFAFDAGQELSEHTAPFDALVQVLEGTVELTIGGQAVPATPGEAVLMPAHVPHAVRATSRFKMLLSMVREAR